MRASLAPFVTLKAARVPEMPVSSPVLVGVDLRPGAYDVVGFATEEAAGDRENWYLLRRRGGESA